MSKFYNNIKKTITNSKAYICEKCGWQTQETKTTEKLKEHCKDCKCQIENLSQNN